MPRYIRYYENGEWKYASVKDIGDISKLKTSNKTDLVSAINELIDSGVLQNVEPSLQRQQQKIDSINQTIQNQAVTITNIKQLVQTLQVNQTQLLTDLDQTKANFERTKTELEQAKIDLLNKADIDYVDGKLVKKVDLTTYQKQYDQLTSELTQKVNLDTYQQEYDQITKELLSKVNNTDFHTTINNINQNIANQQATINNIQTDVSKNANEISQRVKQVDYDSAVGKNKWIVSRYDIDLGSDSAIPTLDRIKGRQPNEIVELIDSKRLQAFNSDKYIAHYFTHVYMDSAKTITLSVTHDDGVAIYMNGAKIYERGGVNTKPSSVALSLRKGWNTIEILHYDHTGVSEYVDLGFTLSSQVDRMTAVIGVGTQYDTRLTQAETQIKQTSDKIALMATKTDVTNLGNRISNAEAQLSIQAGQIASKVSQSDFNAYTDRLTTAESNIKQLKDEIALKVNKTEYDLLNNTVNEHSSQIKLLKESIAMNVDQKVEDGLNQRLTNTESQITLIQDKISLKADRTELDQLDGRLSNAEAQIQLQSNQISQIVKKSELTPLTNKVIKIRYIRDWLNGNSVNSANHWVEIKAMSGTTNRASGKTPTSNNSLTNGSRITDNDTNSSNYANGATGSQYVQIDLGQVYEDIDYIQIWHYYLDGRTYRGTKVEVSEDGVNWIVLFDSSVSGTYKETPNGLVIPVNNNIFNSLNNRLQNAETSITQTANAITLKANKSEVYTINQIDNMLKDIDLQISNINTQIQQNADAINLKANKTDVYTKTETNNLLSNKTDNSTFNALANRVTNTESQLTIQAGQIATKVSQSTFDTQMAKKANASDVYTKTDIQNSSANNLIHNSEWKTDASSWILSTGWTRDTSRTFQGSNTMKVDVSGLSSDTWHALYSEFVNVSAGQELVASGYTFSDDINTIDRGANLEIEWYNDSDSRISITSISIKPTSNNEWQRFYVSGVAPAGTVKARIRFHPTRNGRFWVARPMLQYGRIPSAFTPHVDELATNIITRLSNAEQQITADSIISTVTQSTELKSLLDEKANADDLSHYAPAQQVNDLENVVNNISNTINDIDFSQFVTRSQLDQKADSITAKFSSGGGVNLLRNSVGFAGTDFWTVTGTVDTIQNSELESFGAGSGFVLNGGTISQVIFVTPQTTYTISTIVKKGSAGTGYFKVKDGSQEFIINFDAGTSYNYERKNIQITPVGSQITIELNGDASSGIIFTSTMANIGDIALQWQHAPDEIYNTNVIMNMNGIKVMSSSYNGYTSITPQEFAGYAEVDGQMQKIFTLNRDVTEMSKASIDHEISMSPIKIIPIKSERYNGWAFVATE